MEDVQGPPSDTADADKRQVLDVYLRISIQQKNVTNMMRMNSEHAATVSCSKIGWVLKL